MEITTREELHAIQSLISRLQMELLRELKVDMSTARKMAVEKVGESYNPPISGEEIEAGIGKARSIIYREKRIKNYAIAMSKKREEEGKNGVAGASLKDLYRMWCESHDHVADDEEIAHFTKKTRPAVGYGRSALIKDGWKFEKNGHGFIVTRPTSKKMISEDKVREMMEELLKKYTIG